MISSPNGAALIFAVTSSNLFRSAPLGLFVPDIPKPRALPWADLSTHAQVLGHNLASGGCQPTELDAFDSEGLRRSARRVCGERGTSVP